MTDRRVPGWLTGLVVGGTFLTLLWLEGRRPLRRSVEPKARRGAHNLAVAALSAAAVRLAEKADGRTAFGLDVRSSMTQAKQSELVVPAVLTS
jgi:hypothetical protein